MRVLIGCKPITAGGGNKGYIVELTDTSNRGAADVDPNSYHTHRTNTHVCAIHVGQHKHMSTDNSPQPEINHHPRCTRARRTV